MAEEHQFLHSWRQNLADDVIADYGAFWKGEESDYFGFIPVNCKWLFVGTFPVPEEGKVDFFYHSSANNFWPILSFISGRQLSSVRDKMKLLIDHNIGITDILRKVERANDSRKDTELEIEEYNNIMGLLADNLQIQTLFLTSGGPSTRTLSGKNAGGWMQYHFKESKCRLKRVTNEGAKLTARLLPLERRLSLTYLYTPAPQDDQLGKYLKTNKEVVKQLFEISFLKKIDDVKLKYKMLQWAYYFQDIPGLVHERLMSEMKQKQVQKYLQEFAKKKEQNLVINE